MSTAIPATEVHTIPAVAEKVFPHVWVRQLNATAHGMNPEATLYLELAPYNAETGEIDHAAARQVSVPFWECIAAVPEAAAAMQAVFAAVPLIEAYAVQLAADAEAAAEGDVSPEGPEAITP